MISETIGGPPVDEPIMTAEFLSFSVGISTLTPDIGFS